jgi:hypothetical protein
MKATHKGYCQGCGADQMLPGGVLSKHGYTVEWGFFSGTCPGSNWKPFETHTDLIERFIAGAEEKKAEAEAFIARLQAPPTKARGWVHVYRTRRNRHEHSGYFWHEVDFAMRQEKHDSKPRAYYVHPDQPDMWRDCYRHGIDVDYTVENPGILDYVAVANARKAADVATEVEKIQRYIDWQRRRLAEWKEQPLRPR